MITLACVLGLVYCGAVVPIGERTMFQHIARIWKTDEARDLRDGVKDTSGPVLDRMKRGVQAGLEEATDDRDAGAAADGGPNTDEGLSADRAPDG